jgi:hypothetical protein
MLTLDHLLAVQNSDVLSSLTVGVTRGWGGRGWRQGATEKTRSQKMLVNRARSEAAIPPHLHELPHMRRHAVQCQCGSGARAEIGCITPALGQCQGYPGALGDAVFGAFSEMVKPIQTGDLINIMAKGNAIGMYKKLRNAPSQMGTSSILLRPILPMITAHRLITKWLIPRKY